MAFFFGCEFFLFFLGGGGRCPCCQGVAEGGGRLMGGGRFMADNMFNILIIGPLVGPWGYIAARAALTNANTY